ncbi:MULTISPECIES: ABC-2 transporter permease [Caproicibacterium]|jgi:hypothetical protein|uniref:ABC-2 transporter permease n=1 Tax=Caproicibacterium lactatifermentans TaxID=2666138 RepID=A0A859DRZ9_9FIRM|nr:ABC-2 transporter permease [Caproicibacterium lactatifermentans]ARP49818.1 hypothetical protein B6259_02260 [Ruminococcaceae bacterium CPB6]MDD4807062.1 ABC-2 transporter permease [Oscillospiraceae bacterium]QKN24454.1 ABC-2 transporter permease [Caproicibacterium lactatifermentans]QKO30533.1 ABC-2 transporter permease [Caproicibacterium lactatifermentans]
MSALMLKDWYVITKQMKVFLILILFFSLIPNVTMTVFAILYAAMLPISAMAYDERSKWDTLVRMMPYSPRDVVLSKYVMGYCGVGIAAAFSATVTAVKSIVTHSNAFEDFGITVLASICMALVLLAIQTPMLISMGVEKGRMLFMIIFFVIFGALGFFFYMAEKQSLAKPSLTNLVFGIIFAATILANVISIVISIHCYQHKKD